MTEALLILFFVLLLGTLLVYGVKQVSDYYVLKYHFSLWAGVLLFAIAFGCFALIPGASQQITVYFLLSLGIVIILFTLIQDVRLSSLGMGLLAFVLQFILVISIVSIVLFFIARWTMNKVLGHRPYYSINPGIVLGLNAGEPFRCFFSISRNQ